MAAIRALEWETQSFWANRMALYLAGKHSPQHSLEARAAFVAIEKTRVVGFVAGHRTRRMGCSGELQWINVIPKARSRGIASQLLARMGMWFEEQQAYRVCVNVVPDNLAARKLYARHGARELNTHWMVWEDARTMSAMVARKSASLLR